MNLDIIQIPSTTSTDINKSSKTVPAISTSNTPTSETIDIKSTAASVRLEAQCSFNTSNNDYIINPTKSFTTSQNCLDILTSIQNTVPSNIYLAENCNSSTSKISTIILPDFTAPLSSSTSNGKLTALLSFGDLKAKKTILPEELTKLNNSSFSQNCSNIYTTVKSTSSSISTSISGTFTTFKNDNFKKGLYLNQLAVEKKSGGNVVDIIDLHDNVNNLTHKENKSISISTNSSSYDKNSMNKSSDDSGHLLRSVYSTESIDKLQKVSRLSERAKKKSWYNVLYPNYKSRSQDFKKLFKEIKNQERLIVEFSCALYKDLLLQGRLYISQNYVCFHANFLSWETCLIIKWKDVTSITKEKTALVIPNAISISTPTEKHFFSSFTTRDKTFLILFRIWQNTLMNRSMLTQEIWQMIHNYYGDELGLTTDDEDYIDPAVEDNHKQIFNLNIVSAIDKTTTLNGYEETSEGCNRIIYQEIESIRRNNTNNSIYEHSSTDSTTLDAMKANAKEIMLVSAKAEDGCSSNSRTKHIITANICSANLNSSPVVIESKQSNDSKRKLSKNNRQREESTNKSAETLPTDVSDSSDSEENNIPFVATAECSSPHEGRQLVHTILPINIDTLFNMLFSKSKFLVDFHTMRKSTDLVFGEWITNCDGQKTRTFNVTVQLVASVGPKTSKVTEFQVMRDCSKPGELYSIDVNNVNAGIPYADSFNVLVHYCLVKTVDDHTMLSVHSQIKYKKSVWGVVKGFIEKNAWAGLDDFYTSLLHALQSETCIPPAKGKGRRPRRGTAAVIRPIEEMPILQTKPEPVKVCGTAQNISTRYQKNNSTEEAKSRIKFGWLSLFVLILLCFLIIVNGVLLLKLWKLEDRIEEDLSTRVRMPNLSGLKELPNNHVDWIKLLHQQEFLHETELKKWHTVLQTAIELLKKTERTLAELMFR